MERKEPLDDYQAKLKKHKKTIGIYLKYYRFKRSIEFLEQVDSVAAWKKIQHKKNQRNFRKIVSISLKAASVLVLFVSVTYWIVLFGEEGEKKKSATDIYTEYLFPETGRKKAVLKLDNGQEIDLTVKEGVIHTSDNTVAVSEAGESLSYEKKGNSAKDGQTAGKEIRYNMLQVPRGGEYQLVLEDGTKVWLNAGSSLHYPTDFSRGREVTLVGEAYFEVAKNSDFPFVVHSGKNSIKVLGTKFNVSAYPQNNLYATLVEGSVEVSSGTFSTTLLPDEQAVIVPSGQIGIQTVDASLFTSWTQGRYEFRQTELKDIAEQLSRWYDVNIRFQDESLQHRRFAGVIFRNDELGFATEIIEKVSNVKFIREGNEIYITQYQ